MWMHNFKIAFRSFKKDKATFLIVHRSRLRNNYFPLGAG